MENYDMGWEENEGLQSNIFASKSEDEFLGEEEDEEDTYEHSIQHDFGNGTSDINDIWIAYGASEWSKSHSTYDPQLMKFIEENVGLKRTYDLIPSYIGLFSIF